MVVTCKYCKFWGGRRKITCPDGNRGCAVAHYKLCDHTPPVTLESLEKRIIEIEKYIKDQRCGEYVS